MSRGTKNRECNRSRRPAQRRLHVEALESRELLAGNVLASVDAAGNLRIAGDNAANSLSIIQSGHNSYLLVGQGTTINGQANRNLTGVRGRVDIDLRGGNDILTFSGELPDGSFSPKFAGSFSVRGGAGSDALTLTNFEASGAVLVDGGGGTDTLDITAAQGDDIVLRTSQGNDAIAATGLAAADLIQIETGAGNDAISLSDSTARRVSVNAGLGNDIVTIADTQIVDSLLVVGNDSSGLASGGRGDTTTGEGGRNGKPTGTDRSAGTSGGGRTGGTGGGGSTPAPVTDADEVSITNITAASATIITGGDVDEVDLVDLDVVGALLVLTGDGDDDLALSNSTAANLSIDLGAGNDLALLANLVVGDRVDLNAGTGNDVVTIANLAADELFAILGSGNDRLTASGSVALTTRARLDGGSGNDVLIGNASITSPLKLLSGLETVV